MKLRDKNQQIKHDEKVKEMNKKEWKYKYEKHEGENK